MPHGYNNERKRIIGYSVERAPIRSHHFGAERLPTLVVGGMHGDEPKSVFVCRRLIEAWRASTTEAGVIVLPCVNPDGYRRRRRRNVRRVDLNRNYPTTDWHRGDARSRYFGGPSPASEPETRAVMRIIAADPPGRIISIHSINRHRHCNNYDGASKPLAKRMAAVNGYPVRGQIGYPTPGSFGTWCGVEQGIPMVTLELPSHHSRERCWRDNWPMFRDLLSAFSPMTSGRATSTGRL